MGLLPEVESKRVRAFLRENDRKLALGSRLLQRAVVSKARKTIVTERESAGTNGQVFYDTPVLSWYFGRIHIQ